MKNIAKRFGSLQNRLSVIGVHLNIMFNTSFPNGVFFFYHKDKKETSQHLDLSMTNNELVAIAKEYIKPKYIKIVNPTIDIIDSVIYHGSNKDACTVTRIIRKDELMVKMHSDEFACSHSNVFINECFVKE